MKTASEIRYDFRQSTKRAEELEEMAGALKQLAENRFEQVFHQMSLAWTGEAAEAYTVKGEQLKEHMLKSAQTLGGAASAIRSTAQRVYDAEMKAYRRAKKRNYY